MINKLISNKKKELFDSLYIFIILSRKQTTIKLTFVIIFAKIIKYKLFILFLQKGLTLNTNKMKKKMIFTTLFIVVFAFTCVYNVCFVSNSNKKLSDLTLEGIEAIASPEISDNDCIESKTSIRTETLSDGAVRLFVGYTCGYLPGGPCKKGTVVEYYNANGKYIGQDDQRTNLYCF